MDRMIRLTTEMFNLRYTLDTVENNRGKYLLFVTKLQFQENCLGLHSPITLVIYSNKTSNNFINCAIQPHLCYESVRVYHLSVSV